MDARNDLKAPVPKLCLALETARRNEDGLRVRTSQEMLAFFFPHDDQGATDRLFVHLPKSVRGPILSSWGIRGKKSALRDDDKKVATVVHDALLAGDVDHAAVEQAITPELLVKFIPLTEYWQFWRGGKITKRVIHHLFTIAADVGEIDASWFWSTLQVGDLTGTDALAAYLSKDDLTRWIKAIHQSGDGSPQGILGALGWQFIIDRVEDGMLLVVVDALAGKMGLLAGAPPPPQTDRHVGETQETSRRKETPSGREMTRKPEPSKPPEPSLKPGSRASVRPPMIPIDVVEEPTSEHRTDEYPLAEADALKRLTKS